MTSCKKIICWECHDDAHYTRSGPEISHRFHLLPDKWREKELLPLHDDRTRHLTWAYVLGYSRQGTAKGLPASRCTDPSSQRAVPVRLYHSGTGVLFEIARLAQPNQVLELGVLGEGVDAAGLQTAVDYLQQLLQAWSGRGVVLRQGGPSQQEDLQQALMCLWLLMLAMMLLR